MNILKKLFLGSGHPVSQTSVERPYLKPTQLLELGGTRNGSSYFGAFAGQDGRKYVITFPRPVGPEPVPPKLTVLGTEDRIQMSGEDLTIISFEHRRLASHAGRPLDSYAAEYLDAIEVIASSLTRQQTTS